MLVKSVVCMSPDLTILWNRSVGCASQDIHCMPYSTGATHSDIKFPQMYAVKALRTTACQCCTMICFAGAMSPVTSNKSGCTAVVIVASMRNAAARVPGPSMETSALWVSLREVAMPVHHLPQTSPQMQNPVRKSKSVRTSMLMWVYLVMSMVGSS